MSTEQGLELIKIQQQQEKDRHEREKIALEQRKTAENKKHQDNTQRLNSRIQSLLNSRQTRSNNEYFDSTLKDLQKLNKLLEKELNSFNNA